MRLTSVNGPKPVQTQREIGLTTMRESESSKTFELDGLTFRSEIHRDEFGGEPWKESDGHGIVSEYVARPKTPGERVLAEDGEWRRLYDFAGTMKVALRDGWGPQQPGKTKRQNAAEAVEADYRRMKAWCDDEWYWVGVIVKLMDADGNVIDRPECEESLWGIESDDGDYLDEVAKELAETIAERFKGKQNLCVPIRKGEPAEVSGE